MNQQEKATIDQLVAVVSGIDHKLDVLGQQVMEQRGLLECLHEGVYDLIDPEHNQDIEGEYEKCLDPDLDTDDQDEEEDEEDDWDGPVGSVKRLVLSKSEVQEIVGTAQGVLRDFGILVNIDAQQLDFLRGEALEPLGTEWVSTGKISVKKTVMKITQLLNLFNIDGCSDVLMEEHELEIGERFALCIQESKSSMGLPYKRYSIIRRGAYIPVFSIHREPKYVTGKKSKGGSIEVTRYGLCILGDMEDYLNQVVEFLEEGV